MQNKTKVLFGDNTNDFGVLCAEYLNNAGLQVILANKDGQKILESIRNEKPDVVIMESFMPQLDAIGVMKESKKISGYHPNFIVISGYDNLFIEKEIMENGASYYMLKPVDINAICERIMSISGHARSNSVVASEIPKQIEDLESIVTDVILNIGVPAHVKGYHYIRQAIMLSIKDPNMINAVTKILYPTVAKIYDTTSSRVERAIRHAIEIAWDRGDVDTLNSYFGYTINTGRGKPTNSEFIAMISDKLRLQLKRMGNKAV
ncbi:sporulation transcription factor Spo0A [Paludicola sp. MB14-C6]|uniref:sporulation transcription factor Spo0A n=1 Tax=Paludihabitans sp. MB14-C6 TaxID=3070656 RepID=UPI0027DBCB95|nr:sporulation transcription factor Spo0A [Paludicola sp. MB14-C6]WMJ22784.1 sporulation transcription factor Spo0A [Paludicola sp. MB14-C6]